ncbi:hypothetical protein PG995_013857 [Apiospora arundinis]
MTSMATPAESISVHALSCSAKFREVVEESANLHGSVQGLDEKIEDERDRFELYVKNSGAARTGRSSLQYKLREASKIRHQFISTLQTLTTVLGAGSIDTQSAADILADMKRCKTSSIQPDDIEELDNLVANIARVITSLLMFSVTIQSQASNDRFLLPPTETSSTAHFYHVDIAHVEQKFPKASLGICERLGKANSCRRQYFKYRESHHFRLEHGTSPDGDAQSTTASSIPQALKDGGGTAQDQACMVEDEQSESGLTQTTIAIEAGRLPPLPAASARGPFQCPYCFHITVATTRRSWEKHVLQDLRCYTCLHQDCPEVAQGFERRHDWIQHMRRQHWRVWHCPLGCEGLFETWAQFLKHMSNSHGETKVPSSVRSRPRPAWIDEPCPFCSEIVRSVPEYQRHIGEHQLDLALFALPRVDYEPLEPETLSQTPKEAQSLLRRSLMSLRFHLLQLASLFTIAQ